MSAISGSTGSEVSIRDVSEFVRLREVDRLKEVVASDEEDRAAIEHLFYHERYGGVYESDIRIEYKSVEYVFILSESFKTRSGIQRGRTYQGYLLGVDRSQDSGFFIHLVPHDERFELQNYVWTKEEIRDLLEYEREFQGGDIEYNSPYRLQGDIKVERYREQDYHRYVRSQGLICDGILVREQVEEYKELLEKRRKEIGRDVVSEDRSDVLVQDSDPVVRHPKIEYRKASRSLIGVKISVLCKTDTEKLKQVQLQLGISEDDVRKVQDRKRGWDILTAQRRREAVRNILEARIDQLISERIDRESIREQAERNARQNLESSFRQRNFQIGNHLILLSNANQLNRNLYWVNDKSKLYVIHDEHQNLEVTLQKGVYNFDTLDADTRRLR